MPCHDDYCPSSASDSETRALLGIRTVITLFRPSHQFCCHSDSVFGHTTSAAVHGNQRDEQILSIAMGWGMPSHCKKRSGSSWLVAVPQLLQRLAHVPRSELALQQYRLVDLMFMVSQKSETMTYLNTGMNNVVWVLHPQMHVSVHLFEELPTVFDLWNPALKVNQNMGAAPTRIKTKCDFRSSLVASPIVHLPYRCFQFPPMAWHKNNHATQTARRVRVWKM